MRDRTIGLLRITNAKVIDTQSFSPSMTVSDVERREAIGPISARVRPFDKFHILTHTERSVLLAGQRRSLPQSKAAGTQRFHSFSGTLT